MISICIIIYISIIITIAFIHEMYTLVNILCMIPMLADDPQRESRGVTVFRCS